MKTALPIIPFIAFLSLLACDKGGPVAEGAVEPPANAVGDASANGLSAPENAAAAEAHDLAVAPTPTDGMHWSASGNPEQPRMSFGPGVGQPMLSLTCVTGRAGRELLVERHAAAPTGGTATMSLTGAGHVSSLPMKASSDSVTGPAAWSGRVSGDQAAAIARTFEENGAVQITLGGAGEMIVPAAREVRAMLFTCAGISR